MRLFIGCFLVFVFIFCGCKGSNRDESSGDSDTKQTPTSTPIVEAACSRKTVAELKESCSHTPEWLKSAKVSGESVSVCF